jgi:hypothetical protein
MDDLIALRIRGMILDGTAELFGGATIRRRTVGERRRRRTVRGTVPLEVTRAVSGSAERGPIAVAGNESRAGDSRAERSTVQRPMGDSTV